ncbi:MAG: MFS transporter [Gemmataceae bacterium]
MTTTRPPLPAAAVARVAAAHRDGIAPVVGAADRAAVRDWLALALLDPEARRAHAQHLAAFGDLPPPPVVAPEHWQAVLDAGLDRADDATAFALLLDAEKLHLLAEAIDEVQPTYWQDRLSALGQADIDRYMAVLAGRELPPADAGPKGTVMLKNHPTGLWYVFWGEFAERCSLYGVRSVLALYLGDRLGLGEAAANFAVAAFVAVSYLLPLAGGYAGDVFGKYRMIVLFSVPYVLGHLLLGFESLTLAAAALGLLAVGGGGVKPNTVSLLGQIYSQYRPGRTDLLNVAYSRYYMAVNAGAVLSMFAMPVIRTRFGYGTAFLVPAAMMVVALLVFAAGKPHYGVDVPARPPLAPAERRARRRVLGRIAGLFALVLLFWAAFDQTGSIWVFHARQYTDCTLFGVAVDPDGMQFLNPALVVVLLPTTYRAFQWLAGRGVVVSPPRRMVLGLGLAAAAVGVLALASLVGSPEQRVSAWWHVAAYLLLTEAEVLVSVTGVQLAYTLAPPSLKGFVTGCWYAFVGVANLGVNTWAGWAYAAVPPAAYLGALAAVLATSAWLFTGVARRFESALDREESQRATAA